MAAKAGKVAKAQQLAGRGVEAEDVGGLVELGLGHFEGVERTFHGMTNLLSWVLDDFWVSGVAVFPEEPGIRLRSAPENRGSGAANRRVING